MFLNLSRSNPHVEFCFYDIVVSAKVRFETGIVIQGYFGDWTFQYLNLRFIKLSK